MAANDLNETITWAGRIIVAMVIVATYNKVDADHDKNLVQDGQITSHEQRIGALEGGKKQVSIMSMPIEAILPDGIKIKEDEQ